jgi:hypothetical protein
MDDRNAIREFRKVTSDLTAPGGPFETCRTETDGALVYRHAPTNIHDVLVSAELNFGARDFRSSTIGPRPTARCSPPGADWPSISVTSTA